MSESEEPSVVEKDKTAAVPEPAPAATESAPATAESEDFDHLLNSYSQFSQPPLGTLLRGHVVKIVGSDVIVDVGYKCEGILPAAEFSDSQGQINIQPGDEIEVMMETAEERDGYVVLSRERAKRVKVWDD